MSRTSLQLSNRLRRAAARRAASAAACLLALGGASVARAQEGLPSPFYRVYQYETPLRGWLEPDLWTSYVPSSKQDYERFGKDQSRQGLVAHSLEMEYGATDHLGVAGYLDFEQPRGGGTNFIGGQIETRFHFLDSYQKKFNTAVYAEYILPRSGYGTGQEIETRLILERDIEDFRLDLNPTFSKMVTGAERHNNIEGGLSTGLYYRRQYAFQPGVELYDSFGPIGKNPPLKEENHVLFLTADLRTAPTWWWHLGVGAGLTSGSDRVTITSVLTYAFPAAPPTRVDRRQ